MDDNSQQTEITRKRLLWRAKHRGIKEMDIVVGGFAELRLAEMSVGELALFEVLLEIPDQELLSWTTGQEAVPEKWKTPLLLEMIGYRPKLA
jgi:antitoxin CptB